MLKKIFDFFTEPVSQKAPPVISHEAIKRTIKDIRRVPRHPPFDESISAIDLDSIIETQQELIDRIKNAFGIAPAQFEERVMSSIRNYANYVHLLPASNTEHHNNAGGLFRLGLEVGFYALQAADGKIYSTKESAERRRMLHPKWVFATFLAGLCVEIQRPNTILTVVSEDGDVWPTFIKPLYTWACDVGAEQYFIRWTDNKLSPQSSAASILPMIISPICNQFLNDEKAQIITSMNNSIIGMSRHGDGNLIGELVRSALDYVIDKDIKTNPENYGKLTVGIHLAPTIIDIMRELVRDEVWTVNAKLSRIWLTSSHPET